MASKRKRKLERKSSKEFQNKMQARRDLANDALWTYGLPLAVILVVGLGIYFAFFYEIGNNAENFTDVSYKVTLQEAYPSIVGEVALTHSGGSEVLRLPVTFKFKKWISIL